MIELTKDELKVLLRIHKGEAVDLVPRSLTEKGVNLIYPSWCVPAHDNNMLALTWRTYNAKHVWEIIEAAEAATSPPPPEGDGT